MKNEEEDVIERPHFLILLALVALAVGIPLACAGTGKDGDDRSASVVDEPPFEAYPGQDGPTSVTERGDGGVYLVGALQGDPSEYNRGLFGDVAGHENLAFVGKWHKDCSGTGVDIIDISQPSAPKKLSDTNDYPDTSMEDMQAIEIGGRDILAIGLQDCGNDPNPSVGKGGLELYDITDPSTPRFLDLIDADGFGADTNGVHELDLTTTPSGEVLALGAVPYLETLSSDANRRNGTGDLLIWNIDDPANPTLVGEWGLLDEPSLGDDLYFEARQGGDARTLLHSPRASADGSRVYLSYWDAGLIMLDISDPSDPVYLGRTSFKEGEEGNSHSVAEADGSDILVQAHEDLSPFHFEFVSNALPGERLVVQAAFAPSLAAPSGREMAGEVVHVGRGCPAGSIDGPSPADPHLADPSGKIALIRGGGCRVDNKIAHAQQAGAAGAIVYNSTDDSEDLAFVGDSDSVTLPDGTSLEIYIPAVLVQLNTGLLLRDGTPPVMVSASAVFDGWGYLKLFDIENPANPIQLGTFATENTDDENLATEGWWSVHNPEVRGDTLYASWYRDGVRVLDISDPSSPREIGSWTGEGAPADAPPVDVWSVVPHGDLLLVSDRNYGLYVLTHIS
jgi:hypothetical protein